MPRCGKGTQVRRHLLEEAAIGIAVAILSAGHQYRPFEVASCGRPTWTALTTARSVLAAEGTFSGGQPGRAASCGGAPGCPPLGEMAPPPSLPQWHEHWEHNHLSTLPDPP